VFDYAGVCALVHAGLQVCVSLHANMYVCLCTLVCVCVHTGVCASLARGRVCLRLCVCVYVYLLFPSVCLDMYAT